MNLAFHTWEAGQLLTPEHFKGQEQALLAHMAARCRIGGLPAHGISRLELDSLELKNGRIAVRNIEWLRRDGTFISTDGNATLPAPLEVAGLGKTSIHLLVREDEGARTFEDSQIKKHFYHLELAAVASSDAPVRGAFGGSALSASEACRLLEVKRGADGVELLLGDFVPPLLQLGASPFLRQELRSLEFSVQAFNRDLMGETHRSLAMRERAIDVQSRLVAGRRLLAILTETGFGEVGLVREPVRVHPYQLFQELRNYACALATQPGSVSDPSQLIYDHENLGPSFRAVLRDILGATPERLHSPAGLEFEREGRLFILRNLPREVLEGRNVILALNGASDVGGLKLASPSRLLRLHSSLLPGLILEERKGLEAPVGGVEARYFHIQCQGEEWRHVQNEGALAFQRLPGLALSASLLWSPRNGVD